MNIRNNLLGSTAFVDRIVGNLFVEGEGGEGAGGAPTAEQTAAWNATRVALAGGDVERAKVLEAFDAPEKLWSKITAAEPAAPDPDAWRRAMAGDDEAEFKALARYADPIQARKAWKAATDKITSGNEGMVKVPGDGATPEEIAEYAKAIGVPEKPDGYTITAKPVDGYEPSETDTAFLGTMTTKLDAALRSGAKPQDIVNLAHQIYFDAAANAAIEAEERAADAAVAGEEINRKLWGDKKYDGNIKWAIAGAKRFFPGDDDAFDTFMGQKLANGCPIFDDPTVQQLFLQVGLEHAEDPFMLAAREGTRGFDPNKRINEIHAMRNGTSAQRAEYTKLSAPGGELEKLTEGVKKLKAA